MANSEVARSGLPKITSTIKVKAEKKLSSSSGLKLFFFPEHFGAPSVHFLEDALC